MRFIVRQTAFRVVLMASTALAVAGAGWAQEAPPEDNPPTGNDVVVIVGTQIVGARPTDALPVTVIGEEELDAIAASSGDDLFRSIPQLGEVNFNSSRIVGSINDARGDVASINLRALGAGNTLVLLNGRRMVNHPGTQVENQVPVVTANTNAIPVMGVERVEVLLDGASAIYGTDAVAGVVNTVLKSRLNGMTAEVLLGQEEGVDATEMSASLEFGIDFNDDRSNLSVFASYWGRDPVFASERDLTAQFVNTATTSSWGGFAARPAQPLVVGTTQVSNGTGQFHIQPNTLTGCLTQLAGSLCIDDGSARDAVLNYNVNGPTTVSNGVDRFNLFSFFNHEFDGGLELFAEAGVYLADSVGYREATPMLGAVPIVIPAANYWNPFGPIGSPNRLPGFTGPADGVDISLVGYRTVDAGPSKVEVENLSTRVLAGLRGEIGDWDWESAFLYTEAKTSDTSKRVSNTLFQQALARSTPDAYNPFNGGCLNTLAGGDCTPNPASVIDDITVQVYRDNSTSLASWDAKVSRPDLFNIWGGNSVGVAAGVELRRETFADDRDPRLDGTINFTDMISGLTTNDVMGNTGTPDTKGSRNIESAFVEFAVPLVSPEMNIPFAQTIDMQIAARYENFDGFGSVTKPKVALSWRPLDFLMFRSAWSEGFRAPNLQQQFETNLQRSNARTDFILCEAASRIDPSVVFPPAASGTTCAKPAGTPANADATFLVGSSSQSVISNRAGSLGLDPEESENLTFGFVLESTFLPPEFGEISFTADWWRVEQTNVIGIFGDFNQILLDYVRRLQGSTNEAVLRAAPTQERIDAFDGSGLAPAGEILFVEDNYLNIDSREVEGIDLGLYYKLDGTGWGDFSFRINAAYLETFFQSASPGGQEINDAIASGLLSSRFRVSGEGSLIGAGGRPEWRLSSTASWRNGPWAAGWFTSYVDEIVNFTGDPLDAYQTHNAHVQYTLGDETDSPTRFRLGVRNLTDEEPPLAPGTRFGYLGELHGIQGRMWYASVRKTF